MNLPEKLKPYRSLIHNFTSLSVLQVANYLFPLITLPYIVRVIGPAKYGLINFAAAFIAYFNLICDYGFSLSGTKKFSIIRDDKEKLSKTFSTILSIKLLLSLISAFVLGIIVLLIPIFNGNWEVYLLSYGFVIGGVLFPNWFYQGIEQMKYITIIQVLVRSIATILIFILIKKESDYLLLVFLNSAVQILIGFAGQIIAIIRFRIKYNIPSIDEIKNQLSSGWDIFLSMISINLYTTSNTFILGLFASETTVGYFAAADKLRAAFQGIQSVLSQAVFPFVNNLLKKSYDDFIFFIKKLFKLEVTIGFTVSVFLIIFAQQIAEFLLGQNFSSTGEILRIISFVPFLVSLSNVFGIQMMLPLGYEKSFNKIFSIAAILHLIILMILVPRYFAIGTAIAFVMTELNVLIFTFLFLVRRKLFWKK